MINIDYLKLILILIGYDMLQEDGNIVISPHAANIGLALIFLGK